MSIFFQRLLCRAFASVVVLSVFVAGARAADSLETGFATPPFAAKPWVYWYWNNGNLTKPGITADLEDMKRIGIGGVLILDCAEAMPEGVHDQSPEYWELARFSFEEAHRLGLQVNVGDGPSWSGSGGPWVKPEHGMQNLVTSEMTADGGKHLELDLPQPPIEPVTVPTPGGPGETTYRFYRDIAVLAFPTPAIDRTPFSSQVATMTTSDGSPVPDVLFDHNPDTSVAVTGEGNPWLRFELKQPMSVRGLSIKMLRPIEAVSKIRVEASDDGTTFRTVDEFQSPRNRLGFFVRNPSPYSERSDVNFDPVTAKFFRLTFEMSSHQKNSVQVADVDFHPGVRIADFPVKAGYERIAGSPFTPADVPLDPGTAIAKGSVIDLTKNMDASGKLTWDAPAGSWTIVRYGHTLVRSTDQESPIPSRGLDCDKMSKEASSDYWNEGTLKKMIDLAGPLAGQTLKFAHIDSYEEDCQNWTPKFREEFMARRHYDPMPFFPVMTGRIVESVPVSERFLWDYRRTLADMIRDNWYKNLADYCHAHGMEMTNEPYGCGNFDWFEAGGTADVPSSEFWSGEHFADADKLDIKRPPSSAHTYGKPIINSEAFTGQWYASAYLNSPYRLKNVGDSAFCQGINRCVFHTYEAQPWTDTHLEPGMEFGPWGTEIGRTITWWRSMGRAWLDYLTRSQFLLQQGHFVADAAVFEGENEVPGYGAGSRAEMHPVIPVGYDFDFCSREVVLDRMSVKDGRIVLPDGMSYRFLVLNQPQDEVRTMTPAVLKKLQELVKAGATLIGSRPTISPSLENYPACDDEVKKLADELWGDCDGVKVKEHAFGQGKVIDGETFQEVADAATVPKDFDFTSDNPALVLNWIHRRTDNADIYFVANQKPFPVDVPCEFRVSGRQPEFWHPGTGQIETCAQFKVDGDRTQVPIHFDAKGSVFVVFRGAAMADPVVAVHAPAPEPKGPLHVTKAPFKTDGATGDMAERLNSMIKDGTLDLAWSQPIGLPWNDRTLLDMSWTEDGKPMTQRFYGFESLHLPLSDIYRGTTPWRVEQGSAGPQALIEKSGSYIFDFASGQSKTIDVVVPAPQPVSGPWKLNFEPNRGAPGQVTLDSLISWADHPDPGVKYYSGVGTYTRNLDLPADLLGSHRRIYLDLGRVEVMARVKLNGHDLGILWKPPYRADITAAAKPGANALEVEVVNLWPNRLIGDEQLPDDCTWLKHFGGEQLKAWPPYLPHGVPNGQPRTNGRITFVGFKHWFKNSQLVPSGLLGPVTVSVAEERPLKP